MKRFICILLLILCLVSAFAESTEIPEKRILKTQFFDIIYSEQSIYTANLLYKNADNFYKEIAKKLNTVPSKRFSVAIRADVESLNAYFTPFPYSHIVVYDIAPDIIDLASYEKTILSVFYHELTHAISLNIRSPFWKFLSNVIGDIASPAIATMPLSFIEGVTVSFESANGEGRLNNGFILFQLTEAKLEGNFPSLAQISGARDVYPQASYSYFFGGAFSQYLQKKYGQEKYAELWKLAGQDNNGLSSVFKKVYKTTIKAEYQLFQESIPLLPINTTTEIEALTKLGIYRNLTNNKDSVVYYSRNQNAVFQIKDGKTQKLFYSNPELQDLQLSQDGNYLAVTLIDQNSQYQVKIFDIAKRKFVSTIKGLRNATFFNSNGKQFVVGIEQHNQEANITEYILDELLNQNVEKAKTINFAGYELFSLTGGNQNQFAFFAKNQNSWHFVINKDGKNVFFDLPSDFIVKDISFAGSENGTDKYLFSYATKDYSIPRIALATVNLSESEKTLTLQYQKEDIKGGVFYPVFVNGNYYFVSNYLENSQVSSMKEVPGGFSAPITLTENKFAKPVVVPILTQEEIVSLKLQSVDYSRKNYEHGSVFIPIPMVYSEGDFVSLPFGFTLITSDPYDNLQNFSGAYFWMMGGASLGVYSDFIGDPFSFGVDFRGNFNKAFNFTSFEVNLFGQFDHTFNQVGTDRFVTFHSGIESSFFTYGIRNKVDGAVIVGSRFLELGTQYQGVFNHFDDYFSQNLGLMTRLKIPQLLPFSNPYNATYNLPTTLMLSSFWEMGMPLALSMKTILFSHEIQNGGIIGINPYFNRFVLEFNGKVSASPKVTRYNLSSITNEIDLIKDTISDPVFADVLSVSAYVQTSIVVGQFVPVLDLGAKFSMSLLGSEVPAFSLLFRLNM